MVLVFELTQFVAQAGGFVAILLGLEAELGSGNAANRIENLGMASFSKCTQSGI
jgi:hypothetical protein